MADGASPQNSEIVRTLRNLQEHEITLREACIVAGDDAVETSPLRELREHVRQLRAALDPDTLARYDRMSRQRVAVVVVRQGMCMGCNMVIPKGNLNHIATGKAEPICPYCGCYVWLT